MKASLICWSRSDFLCRHPSFSDWKGAAVVELADISTGDQGGFVSSLEVSDAIGDPQWPALWCAVRAKVSGRSAVLVWFASEDKAIEFMGWLIRQKELKAVRAVA